MRPKHRRFVVEYLADHNATAAYIRSGYTARGQAAAVNACRLKRRPEVAEAIALFSVAANRDRFRALEQQCGHPVPFLDLPGLGSFNRFSLRFEPPLSAQPSRLSSLRRRMAHQRAKDV